jgi:predicted Zn-dependent protease
VRSSDESSRILKRAIDLATKESAAAEASLYGGRYGITKFSDNIVNQPLDGNFDQLCVRLIIDGKEGLAMTTNLSDEGIIKATRDAVRVAQKAPVPTEPPVFAEPQEYDNQDAFDPETDRASVIDRMNLVGRTIIRAHAHGLSASGYVATSVGCPATNEQSVLDAYAVYNSNGLLAYHNATYATISVGMVDERSHSGWAKASSFMLAALNGDGITEVAAQKACAAGEIKHLKSGRYRCVIEPAAMSQLLNFLAESCGAEEMNAGLSFLSGQQGEKITSEKITIRDDFSHDQLRATPFDVEGIARKPVNLIEKGIAKGPVYGSRSARLAGVDPTGHTISCPVHGRRERAGHLVMDGGETGLVELVNECDQAVLISGFGSVSLIDRRTMTLCGATRDGTFLVRDGQVVCPIRNMTFVVSLFDLLNSVEDLSTVVACDSMVVPAIRVSEFGLVQCQGS